MGFVAGIAKSILGLRVRDRQLQHIEHERIDLQRLPL
jgi:hypothetical protein